MTSIALSRKVPVGGRISLAQKSRTYHLEPPTCGLPILIPIYHPAGDFVRDVRDVLIQDALGDPDGVAVFAGEDHGAAADDGVGVEVGL